MHIFALTSYTNTRYNRTITMNKLPVEVTGQILASLSELSHLFNAIISCSTMLNAFNEYRNRILHHVYSLEIIGIYSSHGFDFAVAHAHNNLLGIEKRADAVLLAKSAWQHLIHSVPIQLQPLTLDLASSYENMGRTRDAMTVLERAWQSLSQPWVSERLLPVALNLASSYEKMGRTEDAMTVLERVWQPLSQRSVSVQLLPVALNLASSYEKMGRTKDAMTVLKRAWRNSSQRSVSVQLLLPLTLNLASSYEKMERTVDAMTVLDRAWQSLSRRVNLNSSNINMGRTVDAVNVLKSAWKRLSQRSVGAGQKPKSLTRAKADRRRGRWEHHLPR